MNNSKAILKKPTKMHILDSNNTYNAINYYRNISFKMIEERAKESKIENKRPNN